MAKKRILILGAGLAGLSVAWHLQKKGIDCRVFEKESEVGGLARSKKIYGFTPLDKNIQQDKSHYLTGFTFDYSGHLLHFRHSHTFNLLKSLLGNNLGKHQRSAWIYSAGKYTRYPFQANLYGLPFSIIKECLLGFFERSKNRQLKDKKNLNFLDWIDQTFGKGIARHFMVPYNSKFWTVSPQELTCEWLDGFVPVPSLSQIIDGTIEENQRQFGYNAQFWYPRRGGINQVPLALASRIKNIYTNCKITEINLRKKEIKIASGNKERFDFLISTIPLPEIPQVIKGMPEQIRSLFKKLRWNSIFNLNLGIDRKDNSTRHWIYFPQKELSFFRVGFPHNFSSYAASSDRSSLYAEVAYSENRSIDKSNIVLRIKEDLKQVGLLSGHDKVCAQNVNDIKYGYPIYDKNYREAKKGILKYLNQNNIIPCGRYGSWRYMSMEDVILEGKKVAESFID
ncbi:MAG: FAD-dependent oxidoreductase [Candidatus Omnitrophica bacterium]|nr:FAD-dependent oxidoreductase [Candidatus Omnitrophota bacterium]